jgi:hypothetical protein
VGFTAEVDVQPSAGSVLFFLSNLTNRGQPVLRGEKLIINQWIRFAPLPLLVYDTAIVAWLLQKATGLAPNHLFSAADALAARCAPPAWRFAVAVLLLTLSVLGLLAALAATLQRCCCSSSSRRRHADRRCDVSLPEARNQSSTWKGGGEGASRKTV